MRFQDAPTAFDRIVLAVIGRIIGQPKPQTAALSKGDHPLHELAAPTMVFRTIVEIDHQRRDIGKAQAHLLPPAFYTIGQTIARHFGGDTIVKQLVEHRQQDAHWCQHSGGLKIMIGRSGGNAALAAASEWPDLDCRFRIQ